MLGTLQRAVLGLARNRSRAVLAVGALAVALTLLGTVRLASRNLDAATAHWSSGVQMIVYLEPGTGADRVAQIEQALAQLPAVASTEYVPPERALDRLRESLGEHEELAAGVEPGMLPASIEVALDDGVRDVAAAHPVIARLENVRGVEEVEFLGEWVDQMTAFSGALRYAAWFVTLLVGLACAWVTFASLRLSLGRRRHEAETLALLGASSRFVRAPLLLEGLLQGAAAAGVALGVLWFLYRFVAGSASRALERAFGAGELSFLPTADIALVIATGAALGLCASWLATGNRVVARS